MGGHPHRRPIEGAKGLDVRFQLRLGGGDDGQLLVAVDQSAAVAGHVLDDADHAAGAKPLQHRAAERRHLHRLGAQSAVADDVAGAFLADIEPFRTLNWAPMGMTAHVVYTAWDRSRCASLSPTVIGEIIRGRIGFDGLLMSDDLGMHALTGDFGNRASGALAAGCDLALHCSGEMAEMQAIAHELESMGEASRLRLHRAMETVAQAQEGADYAALAARRDELLAYA